MPKQIDVNETLTRQVAELARLELSNDEVRTFTGQLNQIIHYIEQLQKVSVENTQPLVHPFDMATTLRPDEVQAFAEGPDGKPKVLQSAPEVLYDGYKVPPIL